VSGRLRRTPDHGEGTHRRDPSRFTAIRDFNDPGAAFRLVLWLHQRAWLSTEPPSVLFDLASGGSFRQDDRSTRVHLLRVMHPAFKRRDLYAMPSQRWGDPRAQLLTTQRVFDVARATLMAGRN
jgi:hypothetical protein